MKRILFISLVLSSFFCCVAQKSNKELIEWQKQFGDEWFNARVDSMLQLGDIVPDFALGTVRNNYTNKTNIKDFRGKLVILDMWTTSCTSCIAAWPEMEQLQRELDKEYPGKVQIFLFNPLQSSSHIDERLAGFLEYPTGKKLFPTGHVQFPNLPSLEGERPDIQKLFPSRGVPYHIWIDGNGIVCVMGSFENTYKEKIKELLSGKEVTSIKSLNNTPTSNKEIPYYKLIGKAITVDKYNSFLGTYYSNVNAYASGIFRNIIDSAARTIRSTMINVEVTEMLSEFFRKEIIAQQKLLALGLQEGYLAFFRLYVKDTSRYTSYFIHRPTDKDYVKSRICYEQVAPISMSEDERKEYVLKDLNEYFGKLYGMQASLEKRKIKCYAIVRTKEESLLDRQISGDDFWQREYTKKGEKVIEYSYPFSTLVADAFSLVSAKDLIGKSDNSNPAFLLDETHFPKRKIVTMTLPVTSSFSRLKQALRSYGFDIIEVERDFNYVVIKE